MIETPTKLDGTYKNRIEQYTTDTGNNVPPEPPKESKEPEPTCEHCIYRREEYCNRYPQRLIIKNQAGFLPACGEFDDGSPCDCPNCR